MQEGPVRRPYVDRQKRHPGRASREHSGVYQANCHRWCRFAFANSVAHMSSAPEVGRTTHPQKLPALFSKGRVLRSSNNIQDRLCDLRKYIHFCTKKLHRFNETKSERGGAHISPGAEDKRIMPKRASDDQSTDGIGAHLAKSRERAFSTMGYTMF